MSNRVLAGQTKTLIAGLVGFAAALASGTEIGDSNYRPLLLSPRAFSACGFFSSPANTSG